MLRLSSQGSVPTVTDHCDSPLDEESVATEPDGAMAQEDWWDAVPWDDILKLQVNTATFVPKGVISALTAMRGRIARRINGAYDQGNQPGQVRAWKMLTAFDAVIFSDLGAGQGDKRGRAAKVAEKLALIENGQRGAVWALLEL